MVLSSLVFLSFYDMGFIYVLVICNKRNNSEGKIKRVSGWVNNLPTADRMWYPEVGPLQSPSQQCQTLLIQMVGKKIK